MTSLPPAILKPERKSTPTNKVHSLEGLAMIETHALLVFFLTLGIPLLLGLAWSFLTRPANYYYKWVGSGYKKIKYRR